MSDNTLLLLSQHEEDESQEETMEASASPITLTCPKCHLLSGHIIAEQLAADREEVPDGLVGVSLAECTNPLCLYEWDLVTHGQIMRSMSLWPSSGPGQGVRA